MREATLGWGGLRALTAQASWPGQVLWDSLPLMLGEEASRLANKKGKTAVIKGGLMMLMKMSYCTQAQK